MMRREACSYEGWFVLVLVILWAPALAHAGTETILFGGYEFPDSKSAPVAGRFSYDTGAGYYNVEGNDDTGWWYSYKLQEFRFKAPDSKLDFLTKNDSNIGLTTWASIPPERTVLGMGSSRVSLGFNHRPR